MKTNTKLTKAQRDAVKAYEYALQQEDRYLGSVFVTPMGQRAIEAKTKAAHDHAVSLGVGYLC